MYNKTKFYLGTILVLPALHESFFFIWSNKSLFPKSRISTFSRYFAWEQKRGSSLIEETNERSQRNKIDGKQQQVAIRIAPINLSEKNIITLKKEEIWKLVLKITKYIYFYNALLWKLLCKCIWSGLVFLILEVMQLKMDRSGKKDAEIWY